VVSLIGWISLVAAALWIFGLPGWESFKLFMLYSSIVTLGWVLWVAFIWYVFVSPFYDWVMSL